MQPRPAIVEVGDQVRNAAGFAGAQFRAVYIRMRSKRSGEIDDGQDVECLGRPDRRYIARLRRFTNQNGVEAASIVQYGLKEAGRKAAAVEIVRPAQKLVAEALDVATGVLRGGQRSLCGTQL